MKMDWKSFGLKTGLTLLLLLGTQAVGPLKLPNTTAAAANEVYVPTYSWGIDTASKDDFIIEQGRIMVPVRDASSRFQMGLYTNPKTKTVTLLSYDHKITFQTGSKTAIVNGKKVQLDAAPKIMKGRTYVPFRFFAQAFGYTFGKRDTAYYISFKNLYIKGQLGNETYWMNKTDGVLYYSNETIPPKRIGKLDMKILDFGGLNVEKVGQNSLMFTISDTYGEPHLHDVIYKALLQKNRLIVETKTDYYGFQPHNNVKVDQGYLVMIDEHIAKLVDPNTGKVAKSYDLAALTGGKSENRYVLEYISDDILLIRSYNNSLLTMVNLETKETTVLYKELLTKEWQKILEDWSQSDADYPGDQLRFVKRWQNVFVFEFTDRFNGGKKTNYEYTMKK